MSDLCDDSKKMACKNGYKVSLCRLFQKFIILPTSQNVPNNNQCMNIVFYV